MMTDCLICGSHMGAMEAIAGARCELLRCVGCGYIRNANPPSQGEIEGIEETDDAYDAWGPEQLAEYRPLAKLIDGLWLGERPGRVLEIGCGKGFLLANLRNLKWNVVGIELTRKGSRYAREILRLPVMCGAFERTIFPVASFDLVVMIHTLEHLLDPAVALNQVYGLLAPRGMLFAIVPDFAAYQAEKTQAEIIYPVHISYFTSGALRNLVAKTRFAITDIEDCAQTIRIAAERTAL